MNILPFPTHLCAVLAAATVALAPAVAHPRHRAHHARPPSPPAEAQDLGPTGQHYPADNLYLRRGTGVGGVVFGHGIGQAGTCAGLAFARPASCGARGGYGPYGNGLDYGFGSR